MPVVRFLLVLGLMLAVPPTLAAGQYPRLQLDNGELQVSLYLPDAETGYYRGTRFDWSGIVERVEYAGHRFYAPLHARHDPRVHDSIGGPAGEFAMIKPMGFDEAGPGESFVKIGVGLLEKNSDEEYRFDGDYRLLRAGDWEFEQGDDYASFTQQLQGDRGWGYRYRKVIRLIPGQAAFAIEQRLENTGARTIDVDYYNHNFTLIDDVPYGPDYRVELPFSADRPRAINDLAWFRGNRVSVDQPLGDNALWAQLFEGDGPVSFNGATVRNLITGAAVSFEGDQPITRMVFWAVERAACPEPFIRIYLEPGQDFSWNTRYRFSAGAVNDG
jgi:hypothetical protein